MADELRLELLGGLQISRDGVPLGGFISAKVPALLCYLAVTGRPHFRPALAGLLWGDWPEAEALAHLRKAVHNLRRLAQPWLLVTTQTVALNPEAPLWLDVEVVERLAADHAAAGDLDDLRQAAVLYRGDFLAGFYVRNAPEFEEWVMAQRERFRQVALRALEALAAHHADRQEYAAGIDYAARLLEMEPWREETHRQMMWLLARSGQRSAALAQYERCRRTLASELGVEPDGETTALYRRIEAAGSPRPNNLPAQATSFIGREAEVARIVHTLADSGCRLLTLIGPGGIGKSRLALEAAWQLTGEKTGAFPDGIYLISLAPLPSAGLLLSAIAQTAAGSLILGSDPMAQLGQAWREREMLLLLDSFEAVIAAAPLVAELLEVCPRLKVLATSREPLSVRAEQRLPVAPLAVPGRSGADRQRPRSSDSLLPYPAVALFVDRARAVDPGFSAEEHAPTVADICTCLDGLPLAIELAAARSQTLSPEAMLARLSSRLELLTGGARDLPDRQQTLRTTIAWSYDLLTPAEQLLFVRLAVFADSASGEAIEAVCKDPATAAPVSPATGLRPLAATSPLSKALDSLQAKSLLQCFEAIQGEPRFRMLDTVHEYAWERLVERGESDALRARHAAYYLALAETGESRLAGPEQGAWLARLETEHNNLGTALQWAIDRQESEVALRLSAALHLFWNMRGHLDEGGYWLEAALGLPAPLSSDPNSQSALQIRAKTLTAAGGMALHQGRQEQAIARLKESLALRRRLEGQPGVMVTLAWLGSATAEMNDLVGAERYFEESLEMARAKGTAGNGTASFVLGALSDIARQRGDYALAYQLCSDSLALYREMDCQNGITCALGGLGRLAIHQGDYEQGSCLMGEMLALAWKGQDKRHTAYALLWLAQAAAGFGRVERAVRLLGQVDTLVTSSAIGIAPDDRAGGDRVLASARAQLGEAAFAAAWTAGRTMPLEEAVRDALDMDADCH